MCIRDRDRGYLNIIAYDPIALEKFKNSYPELNISYSSEVETIINCSDVVVIATAWDEFKTLDFKDKKVVDGRYIIKKRR